LRGRGVSRPVVITEIFPFAKRNCHTCHGRGSVLWNFYLQPCSCAVRRFMAARSGELDVAENGDVTWKDEQSTRAGVRAGLDLLILLLTVFFRPLPRNPPPAKAAKDPKSLN
jgi:hypothetical protein